MTNIESFISRYSAVWNEADSTVRRAAIAELWAEDGIEYLSTSEYQGHEALLDRVGAAYEKFVAGQGFRFIPAGDATSHHDAVTFTVHMVPAAGGDPVWTGTVFALLDSSGRIRCDYQFAR